MRYRHRVTAEGRHGHSLPPAATTGAVSPERPFCTKPGPPPGTVANPGSVVVDVVSGCADPGGLRTLRRLLDLEIDPLALLERLVARPADSGVVDEDVARAVIRGDEAVALLRVEPLHSSLRHACSPRALSADEPAGWNTPVASPTGGMRFTPFDAARTSE